MLRDAHSEGRLRDKDQALNNAAPRKNTILCVYLASGGTSPSGTAKKPTMAGASKAARRERDDVTAVPAPRS